MITTFVDFGLVAYALALVALVASVLLARGGWVRSVLAVLSAI